MKNLQLLQISPATHILPPRYKLSVSVFPSAALPYACFPLAILLIAVPTSF